MVIKSHYRKKKTLDTWNPIVVRKNLISIAVHILLLSVKTVKNDRSENYQTYMCICKNEAVIC